MTFEGHANKGDFTYEQIARWNVILTAELASGPSPLSSPKRHTDGRQLMSWYFKRLNVGGIVQPVITSLPSISPLWGYYPYYMLYILYSWLVFRMTVDIL